MPEDMEMPDLEIIEDAGVMDQEIVDQEVVDQMEEIQEDMMVEMIPQGGMQSEEMMTPTQNDGCVQSTSSRSLSLLWALAFACWIRRRCLKGHSTLA